jgi:hypothetical protein
MLRCQAQLELTLMMCLSDRSTSTGALSDRSTSTGALSDRSTFTSTNARVTDLHHCLFLKVLLSSRFLEIDRRRCIWRSDQSGANRGLVQQLQLQLLYDPCVANRARCKQVTYAARA